MRLCLAPSPSCLSFLPFFCAGPGKCKKYGTVQAVADKIAGISFMMKGHFLSGNLSCSNPWRSRSRRARSVSARRTMARTPSAEDAQGGQSAPLPILQASELGLRATDRAFHDIRRLANILSRVNLDARREDLLDYIRPNRARFLKAYAIISWLSDKHGELVVNASNALAEAGSQREQIDTVSDVLVAGIQSNYSRQPSI